MEQMRIDPEELGEAYERATTEKGGGGGGGGRKGKDLHQGIKTQTEHKRALVEAGRKNTVEYEFEHPEISEEKDPGIEATLIRLLETDEEVVGIPSLEQYIQWVYRRLNTNEDVPVEKESDFVFQKRAKGAGGQNVQKVATAVRLLHRYTGIKLFESKERYQLVNKTKVVARAQELVDEHLEKWTESIVEEKGEVRKILVRKIREILKGKIKEDKKDNFDAFCRMMARMKPDEKFEDK